VTWSVYQHWDPLKVCVVGRSYPPEFYSWITVPHVRSLFEKIATETEEDFQALIKKLEEFGVEVLRPDIAGTALVDGKYLKPPMTPRDYTAMVGTTYYHNKYKQYTSPIQKIYNDVRDPSWPECASINSFYKLPQWIQDECINVHGFQQQLGIQKAENYVSNGYDKIIERIKKEGNVIKYDVDYSINGAMISRVGKDLFFGTEEYSQDQVQLKLKMDSEFPNTRNHIINTGGHSDAVYCPVAPGLIFSLDDVPSYADTYPGWDVIYLPKQDWSPVVPFIELKDKNSGKWWIPGFEHNQDVIDIVEQWLGHWTGYVEETVFDINMLIINPKNVIVFNYNKQVFDALERFGITPHIVPFRHRFFWDGGIHCVTSDLHREGTMQDFFPGRKNVR
jgi:hypothetical protein